MSSSQVPLVYDSRYRKKSKFLSFGLKIAGADIKLQRQRGGLLIVYRGTGYGPIGCPDNAELGPCKGTLLTYILTCSLRDEMIQFVIDHLNKLPKESHDTDFSRVKPWYLDGQ